MALSEEQIAFARELFQDVGEVTTRKMFGGIGIYHAGKIFAVMMSDGNLLLKAQGEFLARVQEEGWQPWEYENRAGTLSRMPYWHLPDGALNDPEAAGALAKEALAHL